MTKDAAKQARLTAIRTARDKDLRTSVGRSGHNSSKVTKGKRTFVALGDGRTAWARRWGDLILAHANDLGGAELLSEAQISICRRASTMECELEAMEGRMSAGLPVDTDAYGRLASRLCRLFEIIGVRRLAR